MSLAWKTFRRHYLWKTLFVVCLLLFVGSFYTDNYAFIKDGKFTGFASNGKTPVEDYKGDKVKLDFHVMSQCPYGVMVEDAVAPVLKKMGDAVDFNIYFIGGVEGDAFRSLHGQPEVNEDMRQVCIQDKFRDKYVDYLVCLNKDYQNAEAKWEGCAKDTGIDVDAVKTCFNTEAKDLLTASFAKSNEAGASGSPTIFVNDKPYQSGRDELSFKRAICQGLKDHPECAELPECGSDADCTAEEGKIGECKDGSCEYSDPVKVVFTVLNSKDCTSCDTTGIVAATKKYFLGTVVEEYDIDSEKGKALVEEHGVTILPAYFIDKNVEDTFMWKNQPQIASAFEESGDLYKLLDAVTGASYYIDEDARNQHLETLGINAGDNKPDVDLFVMAQCPYGTIAEAAMFPVLDLLGDKMDFRLGYIASDNGDGTFSSLHGQAEVDEDLRQVCAAKMAPDKYTKYIECQNKDFKNVNDHWESCASEVGIDADALKACAEGDEGKSLLSGSTLVADAFGASGSPSLYIDGEAFSGARTPEGYKTAICAAFDIPPQECDTQLEGDTAVEEAPQGGCGA